MSESRASSGASDDEARIAEQFVRARLEARALQSYPGTLPRDLAAAYRCQEIAIARWPERIGGWKVTEQLPPQLQAQCGAARLIGPAFAPNIRHAPAGQIVDCPVFADGFAAVEPEIVIRVDRNAPSEKLDWTVDEAIEMVGELCMGIEVASSPLPTLLQLGLTAVASDFGANFGIVMGEPIRSWRTLDEITAECFIEEDGVGRGVTSLREKVLTAYAFALGECARRGRPLQAGATITTGTITTFHPIRPGQRSRHVFEGLGEVRCRAVSATPHSHVCAAPA
jgi:2-keto-4-pentenoate hydratase